VSNKGVFKVGELAIPFDEVVFKRLDVVTKTSNFTLESEDFVSSSGDLKINHTDFSFVISLSGFFVFSFLFEGFSFRLE
jgi:hypothetical protein